LFSFLSLFCCGTGGNDRGGDAVLAAEVDGHHARGERNTEGAGGRRHDASVRSQRCDKILYTKDRGEARHNNSRHKKKGENGPNDPTLRTTGAYSIINKHQSHPIITYHHMKFATSSNTQKHFRF
jgi:hypothetical protein